MDDSSVNSSRRRVVFFALLGGLCPLIPIPFIDDVLVRTLRKRMIRGQLSRAGVQVADTQVNLMTHRPPRGLFLGCLLGTAMYVVKKVFRKLLYVFALKDCVDVASSMLHEGWLLQTALDRGWASADTFDGGNESIKELRDAIRATCARVDTRPFNQLLKRIFAGSRSLMGGAAKILGDRLRAAGATRHQPETVNRALDDVDVRDVGELERLLDEMVRAVGAERGYFLQLEEEFQRTLAPTPPPGNEDRPTMSE